MMQAQMGYRHKAILQTIIEQHLLTAQPVSSSSVAKRCGLGLSSATIRSIMVELEETGCLEQPHISSGRIPTDKGYRLYVDQMMRLRDLTKKERQIILEELRSANRGVDDILEIACRVLSRIWGQMALALGPGLTDAILRRVDLIPVSAERVMVVISVASGVIRTVFVEVDKAIDPDRLHEACHLLNDRLSGVPLATAWRAVEDEPERLSDGDPVIRQVLVRLAKRISTQRIEADLHMDGTYRVLWQPEFESRNLVTAFLSVIEAREPLARELSLFRYQHGPRAMIGRENSLAELNCLSIVASGFRVGHVRGAIGVLGPMRMQYATLIPAVQFVAQSVGEILSKA